MLEVLAVCSFTSSCDNRGTQKFWQSLDVPMLPLCRNFMAFCSDGPCQCTGQIFQVHSFTHLAVPGYADQGYPVTEFGTHWKHVCNFLLVRHSNLGPILYCFGDIARCFSCWVMPLLFHNNFGCSHCIRSSMLGSARAKACGYSALKLFSKNSKLSVHGTPGTWTSLMDRPTETIYCRITALCVASRGKHYTTLFSC